MFSLKFSSRRTCICTASMSSSQTQQIVGRIGQTSEWIRPPTNMNLKRSALSHTTQVTIMKLRNGSRDRNIQITLSNSKDLISNSFHLQTPRTNITHHATTHKQLDVSALRSPVSFSCCWVLLPIVGSCLVYDYHMNKKVPRGLSPMTTPPRVSPTT
jgi:hypothetical protein